MEIVRKPASSTNSGELEQNTAQTITGPKTFSSALTASGTMTVGGLLTASGTMTVGGLLTPSVGVAGRVDGTPGTGQIGEVLTYTGNWSSTTLTSNTDISINNIVNTTLPAGVWLLEFRGQTSNTATGTVAIECWLFAGSTAAGGTQIVGSDIVNAVPTTTLSGRDTKVRSALCPYVSQGLTGNVTGTGQFSVTIRSNGATNTLYAGSVAGFLRAIRIA